jgi:hypothetical protein
MSTPQIPDPALLIVSVLASQWQGFKPQLLDDLQARFGPLLYCSQAILFNQTNYYNQELGTPLFKRFLGFKQLVAQDSLVDIKLGTNTLEKEYSRADGRRVFNLDPGLVNSERLVLATGKNYTHRIYLNRGIWADLTLIFQKGQWQALPWTFPDYAGQEIQKELLHLRREYKKLLQARHEIQDTG